MGPHGHRAAVAIAGANISLATLDGLAHSLPIATLAPRGIGISRATAEELGISTSRARTAQVSLELHGRADSLSIAGILGPEAAGALAQAQVAVMPLERLQELAGLRGRITRILIETEHGREAAVRSELRVIAGGRITIARADDDIALRAHVRHRPGHH